MSIQLGDTVRLTSNYYAQSPWIGRAGTVKHVREGISWPYYVEFVAWGGWFRPQELEVVEKGSES